MATKLRIRRSFRDVENDHIIARASGDKKQTELDTLIIAWKGIQELDFGDQQSFFVLGGYHGMPFRGAGWSNSTWWGGFCYHGQILFPTWHRAYCWALENALRSIPGCEHVTLPFLDWCEPETLASGLPSTFTEETWQFVDGKTIPNPLYSYKLPRGIFDDVTSIPDADYTKLAGYRTVRFPLSGLVGGDGKQAQATAEYNATFEYPKNVAPLNQNIKDWLHAYQAVDDKTIYHGTYEKFRKCLDAPNYTLFSNTSSAQQYNQENLNQEFVSSTDEDILVVPLEQPHNDMHLATGGFSVPSPNPNVDPRNPTQVFKGPNGDMGENETAAFDPIFFFHHCYVDRMFWLWQQRHKQTDSLTIDEKYRYYPGANNFDSQGPTPGQAAGEWLTLETPLNPFNDAEGKRFRSLDVINIETQLGYTYGPGSFSDKNGGVLHHLPLLHDVKPPPAPAAHLAISGINRGHIGGSFVISAWAKVKGSEDPSLLGMHSVLSRWHTNGCANCQTHLRVKAYMPVYGVPAEKGAILDAVEIRIHTHDNPEGVISKGSDQEKRLRRIPLVHKAAGAS